MSQRPPSRSQPRQRQPPQRSQSHPAVPEPDTAAPRRSSRASKPVDKLEVSWEQKAILRLCQARFKAHLASKIASLSVNLGREEGIAEIIPALSRHLTQPSRSWSPLTCYKTGDSKHSLQDSFCTFNIFPEIHFK